MREHPLDTFQEESSELLQDMEDILLQLEQSAGDPEVLNSLFRAAHTIKGSSGIFGFDHIVAFTHVVENVLDRMRDGIVTIDEKLVALLLESRDHIIQLIESALSDQSELSESLREIDEALVARLAVYQTDGTLRSHTAEPPQVAVGGASSRSVRSDRWHISLRFSEDALRHGLDPAPFLRYLGRLGEVSHQVALIGSVPKLSKIDPESNYLGFELSFDSEADKGEIEAVFEFAEEESTLTVLPPHAAVEAYATLIALLPEDSADLGEIFQRCGSLTCEERSMVLDNPETVETSESAAVPQGVLSDATQQKVQRSSLQEAASASRSPTKSVRVDAQRLDVLINLVGELVISGAGTKMQARRIGDEGLLENIASMSRLVEEIRDHALQLRMVPVGETFNRFKRVVRDVSKELGKRISLEIYGGETELDKTVVEKIGDPLMHLVRNAMDHGIEPEHLRVERGKPEAGTVFLNAFHDSGGIVIEVADDGGGLDPQALLAKARDKGLVAEHQSLSNADIFRLIFEPGFSTAKEVTNLSGRGVGMDVVRKNIEALRGTIDIDSELGEGTTIRIRLPLSLAIIDGFQVGVGNSTYVIPLDIVQECIELEGVDTTESNGRQYINLRGEVLPFMRLRDVLARDSSSNGREQIVVVQIGTQKAGLVVDSLHGELQTVIKPLGKLFRHLSAVRGTTILGSGEVAIILDVPTLIHRASERGASVNPNRTSLVHNTPEASLVLH